MNEQLVGCNLDLTKLETGALVVLAKECEFKLAADEIVVRLRERTNRQIAGLARALRWNADDVEDAQQEAYCWLAEAIRTYDTREVGKLGGCNFETFAYQVVERRFLDFARHVGRLENHFDHSMPPFSGIDVSDDGPVRTCARIGKCSDPASIAEWDEFKAALNQVLAELDDLARRIWEMHILGGMSLHEVADELATSYDSVRHRWQAAAAHVKVRMAKFA
jgi:RNA polymerase sigma factor (sigma-70 family)